MRINPLQRLAAKLLFLPVNRWEAASNSIKHSTLPNNPLSPKKDIRPSDRKTVMARARRHEKNNPVMGAILEAFGSYGVHTGINPTPDTSDREFNKAAQEYWDGWVNVCCWDMQLSFYDLQLMIDRRELVDGDIFTLLLENDFGDARIQLVEGHRCGSVTLGGDEDTREFDGVLFDGRGRPTRYRFFGDDDGGMLGKRGVTNDAAFVVQHFSPFRSGQKRGISKFGNVFDAMQDLAELLDAELQVAKANTKERDVIANETGEVEGDATKTLFKLKSAATAEELESVEDAERNQQYYTEHLGPETVYIKRGDKYQRVETNRPSPAWQGYVRHNMRTICSGLGVSFDLVWEPSEQGGATVRFQIEKDQRFFERRIMRRIHEYQRIYRYVIGKAIDNGSLANEPRDWAKARWNPPRRASVDLGRDAKSHVALLAAGYDNHQDYFGEDGKDWRSQLRKKAEVMQLAAELAKEFSGKGIEITPEQIIALDPNLLSAKAGKEDADTGKGTTDDTD